MVLENWMFRCFVSKINKPGNTKQWTYTKVVKGLFKKCCDLISSLSMMFSTVYVKLF